MESQPNERLKFDRKERAMIRFQYHSGLSREELQDKYQVSTAVLWTICEHPKAYGDNEKDDEHVLSMDEAAVDLPLPVEENSETIEVIDISDDESDVHSTRGDSRKRPLSGIPGTPHRRRSKRLRGLDHIELDITDSLSSPPKALEGKEARDDDEDVEHITILSDFMHDSDVIEPPKHSRD